MTVNKRILIIADKHIDKISTYFLLLQAIINQLSWVWVFVAINQSLWYIHWSIFLLERASIV